MSRDIQTQLAFKENVIVLLLDSIRTSDILKMMEQYLEGQLQQVAYKIAHLT